MRRWEKKTNCASRTGASVVVVGSGPIRIGQGIEFDYSCVHAAWALHDAGVASVMINNNPETVSTDFDVSDVLIFEPPCADEVEHAVRATGASGTLLIFGGPDADQSRSRARRRVACRCLGTSQAALDLAEDRRKFDAFLQRLGVARPTGQTALSFRKAREIARSIGFPVLVRPSYVLGGRGMEIVYNEAQLAAYAESAPPIQPGAPLLVDKYVAGNRSRGRRGVRRRGHLHPGNLRTRRARRHPLRRLRWRSIRRRPSRADMQQRIADVTQRLAAELGIRGLINVQYIVKDDDLFVIEANPRASRTVPIIAKLTGVPLVAAATRLRLARSSRSLESKAGCCRPRTSLRSRCRSSRSRSCVASKPCSAQK